MNQSMMRSPMSQGSSHFSHVVSYAFDGTLTLRQTPLKWPVFVTTFLDSG